MSLAFNKQIDSETLFSVWKIDETADELYSQLQLKEHETDYLDKLSAGKRNLQWLSTRALLRKMLNTNDYIDCRIDEHGKPFLVNSSYYISLSHSFDYAAVMIGKTKPVGIDLELIKDKIIRIEKKFMHPSESEFIDPDHRIEHLYACWCAKEAIYKLHGKKYVSFLDNIRLKPFKYHDQGDFDAELNMPDLQLKFKVCYEKFENYMIGYVAGGEMKLL